jgi:RimJ/RimL family protein N-acetyltransferase
MVDVHLRPVDRSVWRYVLDLRNQEDVRLMCHDTSIIDLETHEKYMKKLEKDPDAHQWIIMYNEQDVGHVKIIRQELGYMLKKEFRGKGIGVAFHRLIFQEAKKLGILRLKDTIKVDNQPSLRLALRVGFIKRALIYEGNRAYAYKLERILD